MSSLFNSILNGVGMALGAMLLVALLWLIFGTVLWLEGLLIRRKR